MVRQRFLVALLDSDVCHAFAKPQRGGIVTKRRRHTREVTG